jgi:hypothetical protein
VAVLGFSEEITDEELETAYHLFLLIVFAEPHDHEGERNQAALSAASSINLASAANGATAPPGSSTRSASAIGPEHSG